MKVYPHYAIGALTCRNITGHLVKASGALVSPNLVITAAHVIFDRKYGFIYPNNGDEKKLGSSYKDFKFYPAAY